MGLRAVALVLPIAPDPASRSRDGLDRRTRTHAQNMMFTMNKLTSIICAKGNLHPLWWLNTQKGDCTGPKPNADTQELAFLCLFSSLPLPFMENVHVQPSSLVISPVVGCRQPGLSGCEPSCQGPWPPGWLSPLSPHTAGLCFCTHQDWGAERRGHTDRSVNIH